MGGARIQWTHPLWLVYWMFFPFIWMLNHTAQWALRRIGSRDQCRIRHVRNHLKCWTKSHAKPKGCNPWASIGQRRNRPPFKSRSAPVVKLDASLAR